MSQQLSLLISSPKLSLEDVTTAVDIDSGACVYTYELNGLFFGLAFKSKATRNASWHYRFKSDAERKDRIRTFFESEREHQTEVKKRREHRSRPHSLQVGAILVSSWGYEQTNVDFYQVTAVPGKSTVELRQLAKHVKETGWNQAAVTPQKNQFAGGAFRARASAEPGVKVSFRTYAYVWDGLPRHQTSYA